MLKTLCLDLLNLAQMESKSLSLNLGFFDLNALIKKVFDLVHYEAKSRNV
jgi:signal transduction histidine kinase